jgi:ElaB/YqjD/DUF883 family membrane-anchored ribosome-binding protein
MLFDLKGKRRRVVQGVYLTLAILMGAGLVLFGIGSSVNGGLSDLFSGGGGSNTADKTIQKKIDTAEKLLAANPKNAAALADVIRGRYQLATANSDPNTGQFNDDARDDLQQAATAWQRYLATKPEKPNLGIARVMVQAYTGLAQSAKGDNAAADASKAWGGAAGAIELVAAAQPNPNNYVALVQYATLAGQTSKADLAGKKAVALAPKAQKKSVKQQVESAKAAATQQAGGAAGGATGTAP